jgi:hypothetical protein
MCAHLILMKAPAQQIADMRPKPVPQILLGPQFTWPPKNMGGWITTTTPNRLHRHPARPRRPSGSPLQHHQQHVGYWALVRKAGGGGG